MKQLQKLIIPILSAVLLGIVYFGYFAPRDGLGSFSNFDSDNHASQEIIVEYVDEKGISLDKNSGSNIFYVVDADGKEVMVNSSTSLPPGIDTASSIVLVGHLSMDNVFHAHEVRLRN